MRKYIAILIFFILGTSFSQTFDIPEKPKFQTSVYDYVNLLSTSQKQYLERKLINYADTTSTQIVIAIIPSTNGEYIGTLTPNWAHKWGIGDEEKDNGVFILLAKNDRKIWIAPGYGVEHKLTAGITGDIIRNAIIPQFKKGDYFHGLDYGTTAIIAVLKGTYKNDNPREDDDEPPFWLVILIIILVIYFRSKIGGRGWIISSSGSYSGGSGGGFSGGFGGGGFSGGGAGGSW